MSPEPLFTRQTLEKSWRLRLEETQALYYKAREQYRRLLEEQPNGTPHDLNGALALARQVESEALAEYTRVLQVFTDLVVNRKIPEERLAARSDGNMNLDPGKISIVDDDESIRRATKSLLRSAGYEVQMFASAESFLEADGIRKTDCLVLDVAMPGIDGFELQRRLNDAQSHVPIIFITGHDNKSNRATAMDAGAANFFHKPFEAEAFVAAIRSALSSRPSLVSSQPKNNGSQRETDALVIPPRTGIDHQDKAEAVTK